VPGVGALKLSKKTKRLCLVCGKEFETYLRQIEKGGGKYCSNACVGIALKKIRLGENNPIYTGKVETFCQTCGISFLTYQHYLDLGRSKYCSIKCAAKGNSQKKYRKVDRICIQCGSPFKAKLHKIKEGKGKFCSRDCTNKYRIGEHSSNWNGGTSFAPYCPKFNKEFKERVRAFFGYQCVACGKLEKDNKNRLIVHHVTYDKQTCCNNNKPLFVPLCISCHTKTSNAKKEKRKYWENYYAALINSKYNGVCFFPKKEAISCQ
jgi:hypothetical protein